MKITNKLIPFFLVLFLCNCASRKDLIYFQYDKVDQTNVNNNYELTFQPDDMLQIVISTDDLKAAQPFNLPIVANSSLMAAVANPKMQSYLIDKNGWINFPVLGKLKLAGLTRIEAIDLLHKKLSPKYLINPTINILITNFKITVIGDVQKPMVFQLENERISILDAIGLAGDLNISGNRSNVTVIREENNNKTKYSVDLRSNLIMSSPVYYLKQNDVIYIEQNNAKIQDAAYTRSTGLFISLASVLISLLTIVSN